MKNYFVTGYPRSRTAWLANLLTCGPSFCCHDATKGGEGVESVVDEFERIAATEHAEYIGDSDSGLLLYVEEMENRFPCSPWVLVSRDAKEAIASYRRHFAEHPYPGTESMTAGQLMDAFAAMQYARRNVARFIPSKRLLVVGFDDLHKEETIRAIWEHCLPDVPFNYERWKMLDSFRVNIIPSKVQVGERFLQKA
jgi:hypothetical protein